MWTIVVHVSHGLVNFACNCVGLVGCRTCWSNPKNLHLVTHAATPSVYLDERLGVFKSMRFDPELEAGGQVGSSGIMLSWECGMPTCSGEQSRSQAIKNVGNNLFCMRGSCLAAYQHTS